MILRTPGKCWCSSLWSFFFRKFAYWSFIASRFFHERRLLSFPFSRHQVSLWSLGLIEYMDLHFFVVCIRRCCLFISLLITEREDCVLNQHLQSHLQKVLPLLSWILYATLFSFLRRQHLLLREEHKNYGVLDSLMLFPASSPSSLRISCLAFSLLFSRNSSNSTTSTPLITHESLRSKKILGNDDLIA